MESICNAPGTIKGIEVLFFEEAEVTKMKSGQPSFATFGPMSVLYFPQYNRFVLQINDWRYPLLRRLSINSSGSGNYNLPGPNGSTFSLKINKPGQALGNLDALLEGTRKLEASPEDKLIRMKKQADTGPKEVIGETLKQVVHKVQNKVQTLKTGTKNLTSTKKRINLKDIKNKNFKKEAHSKIKKDFFQTSEKLANEFSQRRKENVNLTQSKQLDELKKTSASHAAVYYVPQVEIEEAILNLKEIDSAPKTENKGVVGRERIPEVQQGNAGKTLVSEGMTHYQG